MKLAYFLWAALERFGANGISLLGNVILSYFVTKEDFGIVTSLMIFTQLIFVFNDCGLSDGIMRRQNASNRDFNTLFWFNLFMGLLLCTLFNIFAPMIGSLFSTPDETEAVVRAIGVGAVFGAMNIMPMTRLRYDLKFKKISLISVITVTTSVTTAILLGHFGMRYWAVVMLSVGYQFFMFVYLIITTKWHLKIEFDRATFKQLWSFGVNLMMSVIVVQVGQNIFSFLVGKTSQAEAGLYGQANKLQFAPQKSIEGIMSSTYYTVTAKETDDRQRRSAVAEMVDITLFVLLLFVGTIFAVSYQLIDVVFPAKWIGIVPYLRILLIVGFIQAMNRFMQVPFKLYNRTRLIRNLTFIENGAAIGVAVGLFAMGASIMAILVSAGIISLIMLIMYFLFSAKVAGLKFSDFIIPFFKNTTCVAISSAVAFFVANALPSVAGLFAGFATFFVVLLMVCALINRKYVKKLGAIITKIRQKSIKK